MRFVAALFSLALAAACTFPDYQVQTQPVENPGPACNDDLRNGDETGIDCGMVACGVACPAGQGCDGDADCDGGKCADDVCRAASCEDGLENGAETDLDCGGNEGCERCSVGERCGEVADCDGGQCASGQCREPSCSDDLLNAAETDVDCGGSGECARCGVDQACKLSEDCDGLACSKGKCQPPSCSDGVWNQDETDLDCGGSCPQGCADELKCKLAGDCQSGVCPKQTLRCAAPTCDDGVLNGSEPTLDCGASCAAKCQVLDTCSEAADCESETCEDELCLPSAANGQPLSPAGWVATASHTFGNSSPQNAIDGVQGTDWTTGATQVPGMWFQIDMLVPQVFFSLEIDCTNTRDDSAAALDVAFSNDGTFTDVARANIPGEDEMVITFPSAQVARYIKISLAQGTDHWWRMDEIRVKQ